ncbi:MAG: hypothetical protein MUE90_07590 [Thermoanaerobaculales bacterium]|jgi:hypothetical protein|nr:hypothetical protein [Thermoanaerobaculales bacterium]
MTADSRRLLAVFAVLVAAVAAPFVLEHLRERRRPVLAEARVVTATEDDPVLRTGRRRVAAGVGVEVALALRLSRPGRADQWLAPGARLVIDGEDAPHLESDEWPDEGRSLRVFWFTVESGFVGGDLSAANAGERLRYRTFLAPEMGRGLRAARLPETHNDDHLGELAGGLPADAGALRVYARVELVEAVDDLRPLQSVTTLDPARILEPRFPALLRSADLGPGVRPEVGELFGLPGFEPAGETAREREEITSAAFGLGFSELVEERLVASSWTFAAVAALGRAGAEPAELADLGEIVVDGDRVLRGGRPLAWGGDLRAGDLVQDGRHWLVLLGDNGDGVLDLADAVLHCWRRPPERTTLLAGLGREATRLGHRRAPG